MSSVGLYSQWCRNEFESGGASVRSKSGGTDPAQSAGKIFVVVPLHFVALKAQLVVLVSAFMIVSTVWSVSSLPFFYSRCPPPCPAICKSGGHVPHVPRGVGATVYSLCLSSTANTKTSYYIRPILYYIISYYIS